MHLHTAETSRCAKTTAAEAVRLYKEQGYAGIVVTDHYNLRTFLSQKKLLPERATELFLRGYHAALQAAGDDFTVLLGMELRYLYTANDYLVYGVTEEFLQSCGNLLLLSPARFLRKAHKNGLLVLQAHPFRAFITRTAAKHLDGAEIFNGKDAGTGENERAERWAKENRLSILTCGSDFHRPEHLAACAVETDERIENNRQLTEVLRSGRFRLVYNR